MKTGVVVVSEYRFWFPFGLESSLADSGSDVSGMDIYCGQIMLKRPLVGRIERSLKEGYFNYPVFYRRLESIINGVYTRWNTQSNFQAIEIRKVFLLGEGFQAGCLLRYLADRGEGVFIDGVILVAPDDMALLCLNEVKPDLPIIIILPKVRGKEINFPNVKVIEVSPCRLPSRLWHLGTRMKISAYIKAIFREWSAEEA